MKVEIFFKEGRKLIINAAHVDITNYFDKFNGYVLDVAGEEHYLDNRNDINLIYVDGELEYESANFQRI